MPTEVSKAALAEHEYRIEEAGGVHLQFLGLGPNGYGQYLLVVVPFALDRLWNEKRLLLRMIAALAFWVCSLQSRRGSPSSSPSWLRTVFLSVSAT